jgi:hypothetical protein
MWAVLGEDRLFLFAEEGRWVDGYDFFEVDV